MRLYLINPCYPSGDRTRGKESYGNRYRLWKPLSLLIVAGLTPPDWDITIVDENLGVPDYQKMPRPDLVGLTAFTAQAVRAYEVAEEFRLRGVPVVMGGMHATMCSTEALERVDAVVSGEAESIWATVLEDVRNGVLKRSYSGPRLEMDKAPPARHDLSPAGYPLGAIQTTRGCPLNCSFCSVTAFNGGRYRFRPVEEVIREFKRIREKHVLIVDDNLIGTRKDHLARTKDLFRAMIEANLRKKWLAQVTINMSDDEEMLRLAEKAGCLAVYIGFESPHAEGLAELNKRFNIRPDPDIRGSVRRMQRRGILVVGSFIMGLDVDEPGIGWKIAEAARRYGVDFINVLFLTPLPGTTLWQKMESEGRIISCAFPEDWKYYTLTYPVAGYRNMSWTEIVAENEACYRAFYSYRRIIFRLIAGLRQVRKPFRTLLSIVGNLTMRDNMVRRYGEKFRFLDLSRGRPS
jgi:radical SAM superfamily enzyme YgiQ (UPF0313 family)